MKRYAWLVLAMGLIRPCGAQTEATLDEGLQGAELEDKTPWVLEGGLLAKYHFYEHDALQQRAPNDSDQADAWEEGDTDGYGWGVRAMIGRGDGALNLRFIRSDFNYTLTPSASTRHEIKSACRDFEANWAQIRGRTEYADWGSTLGVRYLGVQKDVTIREGSASLQGDDNINWLMILGGYDGHWWPFRTRVVEAHGSLRMILGEVNGIARSGSDENWGDGAVAEVYANDRSLAYGANVSAGLRFAITRNLHATVDYAREWLYSFDSVDTGIVVFPDNSDALFIENQHGVVVTFGYTF